MRRRFFFEGEVIANMLVVKVLTRREEAKKIDHIRYRVRCERCGDERNLSHSTLRQRISDKVLGCLSCSRTRDYDVIPPTWPVPKMLAGIPRGWEK